MTESNFESSDSRLSRIETQWSLVQRAHAEDAPQAVRAQQLLLMRYGASIRRYLGAALRDPDAADEVFQEFALKFVKGDLKNATPQCGRFRQFVKTVLYRLMMDHHRRRKKGQRQQAFADEPSDDGAIESSIDAADEALLLGWRDQALGEAWEKLDEYSNRKNAAFYRALKTRVEHPSWTIDELAERLGERTGQPLSNGATRSLLHRARDKFAELLVDAVEESMDSPTLDQLEEEMVELRLLDYCRDALAARREST